MNHRQGDSPMVNAIKLIIAAILIIATIGLSIVLPDMVGHQPAPSASVQIVLGLAAAGVFFIMFIIAILYFSRE